MLYCLIHMFWLNMSCIVIDFLMSDEEVWAFILNVCWSLILLSLNFQQTPTFEVYCIMMLFLYFLLLSIHFNFQETPRFQV